MRAHQLKQEEQIIPADSGHHKIFGIHHVSILYSEFFYRKQNFPNKFYPKKFATILVFFLQTQFTKNVSTIYFRDV